MLTDLFSFFIFRFSGRIYQHCCAYCDQSFRRQFLKIIPNPSKLTISQLPTIHESENDTAAELKFIIGKTKIFDPYHGNSIGLIETTQKVN